MAVTASGTQFFVNGKATQFRGINVYCDPPVSFQDNGVGQWGTSGVLSLFPHINYVRLNSFTYPSVSFMTPIINSLTAAGVVCEIEDHNYPTVLSGSALTTSANWYKSMATAFASNPLVIFGTQNEPDLSAGWAAVDNEMQTIYNAIRGTGNNTLVLLCVAGGFTTSGLTGNYAGLRNVGWDVHYYNWIAQNSTSLSANVTAFNNTVGSVVATANLPVIIAEYGVSSGALGAVNDPGGNQVVQAVDQSGYSTAAWAYTSGDPSFPLLLNSASGDPSQGLTAYGSTIASFIALNATTPPPSNFTYTVYYGTAAATNNGKNPLTGGWSQFGSAVSTTSDTVTGLSPGVNYFFSVIATDTTTGAQSQGAILGPVVTSGTPATESPEGTSVTATNQTIAASKTPGTASSGPFDLWTISAAPGPTSQAVRNGNVDGSTSSVLQLYYHSHTVYRQSGTASSNTWTSWSGTAWTASSSPIPTAQTLTVNAIAAQTASTAFTVTGVVQGYASAPTLQYQDNQTGSWTTFPSGSSVSTSSFSFTHPGMVANSAATVSVRDGNATTVVATSNAFAVNQTVSLNSIVLSSQSVTGGAPIGTTVATVTVNTTPANAFSGSLTLTAGAPNFQLSGSNLLTGAVLAANTYPITIKATQATQSLTASFTITANAVLTTMNPSDASPTITFSNNNLTVTSTGTKSQSVRASREIDFGKIYFEATINTTSNNLAVGIVNDQYNLAEPLGLGTDAVSFYVDLGFTSYGYRPSGNYRPGQIVGNNGQDSGSAFINWGQSANTNGAVVGFAVDVGLSLIYITSTAMQTDGNGWNNNTTSNPSTGVGGLSLKFIAPGPYFAAFNSLDSGSSVTFNFAGPFHFPIPTGFEAYDTPSRPYTAPLTTIGPPIGLGLSAVPTSSTASLSWSPPSLGTGPFTYDLGQLSGNVAGGSTDSPWNISTVSGTSTTVALPEPSAAPCVFFVRVRAKTSAGNGPWSTPVIFQYPTISGLFSENLLAYPSSSTSSQVNFTKVPIPQDPTPGIGPDGTQTEELNIVMYAPATPANAFITAQLNGSIETTNGFSFAGTTESTPGNIPYNSTKTFFCNSLVQNQEYLLVSDLIFDGHLEPGQYQTSYFSLPATAPFSGGFGQRLLPGPQTSGGVSVPAAIPLTWGGLQMPMVPFAATTHFAIYYDPTYWTLANAITLITPLKTSYESAYTQLVTWFGSQSNQAPVYRTSINPNGSLVNVFLTATQGFGGAHLTCSNADIMLSASTATVNNPNQPGAIQPSTNDLMNSDFFTLTLMAELSEVFMPNLASLPDCDQHALGEGLSLAMAYDFSNTGWNSSVTVARLPASWMNGSPRQDFVNTNPQGETLPQFPAIGCATLFFTYLVHQLGFTYTQICTALRTMPAFATLRVLYNTLASNTTDPFPSFVGLLNSNFPPNTSPSDTSHNVSQTFINPWPLS